MGRKPFRVLQIAVVERQLVVVEIERSNLRARRRAERLIHEETRRARGRRRESQRLFDLVQNLLDTSALESGKQLLFTSPVDLAALVREAAPRSVPERITVELVACDARPVPRAPAN